MGLHREEYPAELVRIAKKRVQEHLHGLRMVDFSLEQMAVNIYLQAVHDLATAQKHADDAANAEVIGAPD